MICQFFSIILSFVFNNTLVYFPSEVFSFLGHLSYDKLDTPFLKVQWKANHVVQNILTTTGPKVLFAVIPEKTCVFKKLIFSLWRMRNSRSIIYLTKDQAFRARSLGLVVSFLPKQVYKSSFYTRLLAQF